MKKRKLISNNINNNNEENINPMNQTIQQNEHLAASMEVFNQQPDSPESSSFSIDDEDNEIDSDSDFEDDEVELEEEPTSIRKKNPNMKRMTANGNLVLFCILF